MAQMGFFDLSDRYASLDAKKDPLVEIDTVVPWEEFRATLERVWRKPDAERKSRAGRKPMDAVLMFKALVLSALYNLSDDQIEYQVRDRLSFMRFLGLGLGDRVPDAKTVWLYREALAKAGMVEALFSQFDGYLARQGYIARGGQILDASIVAVPRNHNTREENATIKNGEMPEDWADKPAKRSQKDTEARWTKKHGKSHYGYKMGWLPPSPDGIEMCQGRGVNTTQRRGRRNEGYDDRGGPGKARFPGSRCLNGGAGEVPEKAHARAVPRVHGAAACLPGRVRGLRQRQLLGAGDGSARP